VTTTSLYGPVQSDLPRVEEALDSIKDTSFPALAQMLAHVLGAEGKRLRPALALLSGRYQRYDLELLVPLAASVELLHTATLVHDDVLDDAELRRKGATINHLRGNEAAVLLGDYLISHSFHLCSSLDSQFASRVVGQTTNQVCEGELLQIHHRNDLDLDQETYLQIITCKTAVLCASCCLLGATFAGADGACVELLRQYGQCLGTAFQIQDDILDIVGEESTVGKTLGLDMLKGKLTLPIIHFLATAPHEHRALLRSLLKSRDADKVERIRNLILPSPSVEYATWRAKSLISRARAAVAALPDSPSRQVLDTLADFVITRPM